jgi:CNT family concentrative nucleoside transporter
VVAQPVPGGTGTEPVVVGFIFAIKVLPILIFMASVSAILYHLRILPLLVGLLARGLSRAMGISGAEALSTIGDVFLGMTEAPLLVRPYIARMTESELFTLMTAGMATIAGTVLLAYTSMGIDAGILVTASFMAAPVAVLLAKIMVPEKGTPETLLPPAEKPLPPAAATAPAGEAAAPVARRRTVSVEVPRLDVNIIDAAARGAGEGLHLALNVGAMLLAFVALVHMADRGVGALGGLLGHPEVRLATVLGWPLAPLAFLMGVPWSEAPTVVVLGGLGTMVPERRPDIARLGLRSVLAGGLATCLVASIAGLVA